MPKSKDKAATGRKRAKRGKVRVFVGTRKGLWTLTSDAERKAWDLAGPTHLGCIVHHVMQDPRDRKSVLMASRTGHLGPTVFRSTDGGGTWVEASRPPAEPPTGCWTSVPGTRITPWPGRRRISACWEPWCAAG